MYAARSINIHAFVLLTDIPLCDCKEILDSGLNKSGLYKIDPDGDGDFTVFCDMSLLGGGWTVFQRRIDDDLTFERKWKLYRNGFGNLGANFWLGLNKIKRITDMGTYELYVGLEDHYTVSETTWAKYGSFSLGSEASNYKLTISSYVSSSTAGDSLATHNGEAFSTLDDDNDSHTTVHCSETYKGGWWYKDCHDSNLNGVWYVNGALADPNTPDGIIWQHWKGDTYSLKTTVMAVRPA